MKANLFNPKSPTLHKPFAARSPRLRSLTLAAILAVSTLATGPAAAQCITEIINGLGDGTGNNTLDDARGIAVDTDAVINRDNAIGVETRRILPAGLPGEPLTRPRSIFPDVDAYENHVLVQELLMHMAQCWRFRAAWRTP